MNNLAQDGSGQLQGAVMRTSDAQREILASVALGDDASCAFNMCVQIDFPGCPEIQALSRSVLMLGQRHQMLRARFSVDGEAMHIDDECTVELKVMDLRQMSIEQAQFSVTQLRQREVSEAFDLVNRQAWRIHLAMLADQTACIVITAHHVIADGWSMAVIRNDLELFYNAFVEQRPVDIEPSVDFSQYLEYLDDQQSNGTRGAARDYWVEQFEAGVPAVDFPLDRARPPQRTYSADRCDVRIPREVADALRKMARDQNNSLFNVLFSAFFSYLYRSSGAEDLVVGIPAAGHTVAGLYEMVGHCVNILPVRQRLTGDQPYSDLLQSTRSCMLDAQDHQEFTFSELMGELELERDPSRIPVISMMFNIDQDTGMHNYSGLEGRASTVAHRYENFEVFCNILDRQGELTIEWAYNTRLFSAEATEHRVQSFVALLTQIAYAPQLVLDDLSLFSFIDQGVYNRVNNTELLLPHRASVLSMLESALDLYGDNEALVVGDQRFSYTELHEQSNQLAHFLQSMGLCKGDWVAICMERSPEMVVTLIALMKIGATYVPLDPAYPANRVSYILENACASVVITQSQLLDALPSHAGENICIDLISNELKQYPVNAPTADLPEPNDLIYVIYTSGSTGNPKGVKLKHSNVANFMSTMAQKPGLEANDRLVAVTTLSFDIAVLELLLPLTVGACVVVATKHDATDADALNSLLIRERATTLQATPATWRMLFQGGWKGNNQLKALVGGEALARDLAMQLAACTEQLWNMYGPTETAIWSTCERITPATTSINIGKPIGNTRVYVLDEHGHPAPIGVPGELLIGGAGVCAGYHQRDDLTRQVFVRDIFSDDPNARLYRTRDRVKLHPDGRLEYLERMDNQVKVRGYRIELGEIETVLGEQPNVSDCAMLAREDIPGDVRLVAYVCTQNGQLDENTLSMGLRQRLPVFMQPQHYVLVDDMPRTPNGKLDRKALPAPTVSRSTAEKKVLQPRTDTEKWVASEWSKLIGESRVGFDDNFFSLGGHSLLAMRFIADSRKRFKGSISLRMLLSDSLGQIAATLDPEDKPTHTKSEQQDNLGYTTTPYFIGTAEKQMFCSYHAPKDGRPAKQALLFAQPLGHEYQRGHRAMRELAVSLSAAGCAVLRFDYRNTGDSAGEPDELSLEQLQQDLREATDELCRRSNCQKIDVLSLRIGSLLAGSISDNRWDRHFAWDPVVHGESYLQLLQRLHRESLADWDRYITRRSLTDSGDTEYVGYEYPVELMANLANVKPDWVGNCQIVLSAGEEALATCDDVVADLQVEPQWNKRDNIETHLQMPADLALFVKTITEAQK